MKRTAQAQWSGALRDGKGSISTQSGALKDSPYTFKARFEDESGTSATNPEELIAAAHASCFTMQLSHFLAEAGHPAAADHARVHRGARPVEAGRARDEGAVEVEERRRRHGRVTGRAEVRTPARG